MHSCREQTEVWPSKSTDRAKGLSVTGQIADEMTGVTKALIVEISQWEL